MVRPVALSPSSLLKLETTDLSGYPERLVKLPLLAPWLAGRLNTDINSLVHGVIIGPTDKPFHLREAIVSSLEAHGMRNPQEKVWVSEIPLRN